MKHEIIYKGYTIEKLGAKEYNVLDENGFSAGHIFDSIRQAKQHVDDCLEPESDFNDRISSI
jgi:hypothetical protein